MKRWFEHQLRNQRNPNYVLGSATQPVANVYQSMQSVFEHIRSICHSPQVSSQTVAAFDRSIGYPELLAKNGADVDLDTLQSWIYDDSFADLLTRPSHELVTFNNVRDIALILQTFCQAMKFEYRMTQVCSYGVKMHVQHPGQMFPLHIDRPWHNDFHVDVHSLRQVPSHQRYLVFMEDQQPGQLFQMDLDHLQWRAGDVFTWDAASTMHGSANMGYWPRYMLLITLKNLPQMVSER